MDTSIIRIAIIDDEHRSIRVISTLLNENFDSIKIIGTATNVLDGFELISNNEIDLLFLDISLPPYTGFDLLDKINKINFKIIFVTAFEEHALKAFKYAALDYILKPILIDELKLAINKYRDAPKNQIIENTIELSKTILNENKLNKIAISHKYGYEIINVEDICYMIAEVQYTKIVLTDKRVVLSSKPLLFYDELLSDTVFFRSHKSFLINMTKIKHINYKETNEIILQDGSKIPISFRKKPKLIELLKVNKF